MKKEKGISILLIVMIVSVLVVLGLAGFLTIQQYVKEYNNQLPNQNMSQNNNQQQHGQIPQDATASWNVLNNSELGFSLKYPNNFFDVDHEPRVLVGDCNYTVFPNQCPNIKNVITQDVDASGNYVNASGSASKNNINDVSYCATQISDAAAGHVYHYYYYFTVKNQKCLVVYLATSSTNCDNYLPLETGNTGQQQNYQNCVTTNANQPTILQQIVNTFTFTK